MSLYISDWYETAEQDGVRLAAGRGGFGRVIRRLYMVEKPELSATLTGGEIIFITGVALSGPDELLQIVQSCERAGAVAVVVGTGRYIPALPDAAAAFCDQKGLPLFEVSPQVPLERLIQTTLQLLAGKVPWQSELESLIHRAIRFPEQAEACFPGLKERGFDFEGSYCIALLRVISPDHSAEKQALFLAQQQFRLQAFHGLASQYAQYVLLLFCNCSAEHSEARAAFIAREILEQLGDHSAVYYGVGRCVQGVNHLAQSYSQAEKVLLFQLSETQPSAVHTYDSFLIRQITARLEESALLREIYSEYFLPLLRHDRDCGTDYVAFIQNYLRYNGSVRDISEKMLIHRNTVHYKIRKIELLLGCELQRSDSKMYLLLALAAHRDFSGQE